VPTLVQLLAWTSKLGGVTVVRDVDGNLYDRLVDVTPDGVRLRVNVDGQKETGSYRPAEGSGFLPIRAAEVRRWVVEEDVSDESAWARRLRAWIPGRTDIPLSRTTC